MRRAKSKHVAGKPHIFRFLHAVDVLWLPSVLLSKRQTERPSRPLPLAFPTAGLRIDLLIASVAQKTQPIVAQVVKPKRAGPTTSLLRAIPSDTLEPAQSWNHLYRPWCLYLRRNANFGSVSIGITLEELPTFFPGVITAFSRSPPPPTIPVSTLSFCLAVSVGVRLGRCAF